MSVDLFLPAQDVLRIGWVTIRGGKLEFMPEDERVNTWI